MKQILDLDKQFFLIINNKASNPLFDFLMPFARNPLAWAPLYVFLLSFCFLNFRKNVWWWLLVAICTSLISDFVSSQVIKENIFRLRPCNDPSLADTIRLFMSYKPKSSSFTSSHACTHFALAAFFANTLRKHIGNWKNLFYLWASLVAFAQVYIGVHFPLDVLCGGIIGYFIGKFTSYTYNKYYILA